MKKNSKFGSENEDQESDNERNTASLRAEIEDTRERLSADVDALGAKISPKNMKAEAKQAIKQTVQRGATQVRDGVSSAGSNLLSVVKENPVPLALIGAGVGLLVWNLRDAAKKRSGQPNYAATGRSGVYDPAEHDGEGADGRLRQLGERARQGVGSVKRAASDTLEQAQEQLGKATDAARDGARRARDTAVHTLDESPMLLGALALGAGVAVGLSIPSTESENQLVGQYRDRFLAKAKEKARDLGEIAKETARSAAARGADAESPGA